MSFTQLLPFCCRGPLFLVTHPSTSWTSSRWRCEVVTKWQLTCWSSSISIVVNATDTPSITISCGCEHSTCTFLVCSLHILFTSLTGILLSAAHNNNTILPTMPIGFIDAMHKISNNQSSGMTFRKQPIPTHWQLEPRWLSLLLVTPCALTLPTSSTLYYSAYTEAQTRWCRAQETGCQMTLGQRLFIAGLWYRQRRR